MFSLLLQPIADVETLNYKPLSTAPAYLLTFTYLIIELYATLMFLLMWKCELPVRKSKAP